MGGFGSGGGHRGRRANIGDCRTLNINRMIKCDVISKCGWRAGDWGWTDQYTGERSASISYESDTASDDPFLRLHYTLTSSQTKIDYKIRLVRTGTNYGGERWWFICPVKGRRIAKLYLPPGGDLFASRHAYRLSYGSQSDTPSGRAIRKMWKIRNKIGGDEIPERPKGMHNKTFQRLVDKADDAEFAVDAFLVHHVARLFAAYPP